MLIPEVDEINDLPPAVAFFNRESKDEINTSVKETGFSGFENRASIVTESTGDITVSSKIYH